MRSPTAILRRGESLYEEPLHLLREEQGIREPGTYFAIVREVAAGRTTVSEIANGAQVSVPNLTKMLRRLVELGYLEARAPLSPPGPRGEAHQLPAGRSVLPLLVPLRLPQPQPARARPGQGGAGDRRARHGRLHGPGLRGLLPRVGRALRRRCAARLPAAGQLVVEGRPDRDRRRRGLARAATTCSLPASGPARRPPPPLSNSSSSATRCPGPAGQSSPSSPAASPRRCAGARTRRE